LITFYSVSWLKKEIHRTNKPIGVITNAKLLLIVVSIDISISIFINHVSSANNPAVKISQMLRNPAAKNNAPCETRGLAAVGNIDSIQSVNPIGTNTIVAIVDKNLKNFSKSCSGGCGTTGALSLALVGAAIALISRKYWEINFFILKLNLFFKILNRHKQGQRIQINKYSL
jgi:hypothetical protein